jgi:protein gp37
LPRKTVYNWRRLKHWNCEQLYGFLRLTNMGKDSAIEWTDHTFNPWWGCVKVSPGCNHCYAETWAKRVGQQVWGNGNDRRFFTDKHWREPLKWNKEAQEVGRRKRVFCASMADVFELRSELDSWRDRLWSLIGETPALDWLLLTKRPQNIESMAPWATDWPDNVWIGTTVEDQTRAEERLPFLLKHPAKCRFLSCEPLLGPVDLSSWIREGNDNLYRINWVIAGGESGHNARPMLPRWARLLRDQCFEGSIPFHFKQWGHWAPISQRPAATSTSAVRRFWDEVSNEEIAMEAKGKHDAGRDLDGVTWNEVPVTA